MRFNEIFYLKLCENEVWAWCVCLGALGFGAASFSQTTSGDYLNAASLTEAITGAGAFNLAGWSMVALRLGRLVSPGPAPAGLIFGALAFGVICALPFPPFLALMLAGLGVVLIRAGNATKCGREAGWLILLPAISEGAPFAKPIHMIAAQIDAVIVGLLVHPFDPNAMVVGNMVGDGNFRIEIFTHCASSTPLPEVALAYLVVLLYRGGRFSRRDWKFLAGSLIASIVLTELRLMLMVPSEADWRWWHFGTGNTIYQLAALSSAVAFPAIATAKPTGQARARAVKLS